jgi:hypothetical protein
MFFQGTITTSSPSATPLSALLQHLSYYVPRWSNKRAKNFDHAILLLLLTPSYARHALDPELSFEAFRSMSGGEILESPLGILTAVVDALPGPRIGEDRREGLAYLYRQLTQDELDFWTEEATEKDRKVDRITSTRSTAAVGDLNFFFDGLATASVAEHLLPDRSINERSYTITLPLAQTLFSTGRTTTMQFSHFAPATTDHRLQLKDRSELQSAGLSLPFTLEKYSDDAGYQVSGRFRLTPLTSMRRVKSCLGNVVKTISAYPSFGSGRYKHSDLSKEAREAAIQPASQELEEAISAYFSKQNTTPAPVDVYALILPFTGESFALRDDTKRSKAARMVLQFNRQTTKGFAPMTIDQAIRDLIVLGDARLCKVLSGGGGWGEKKGLLSLDPDSCGPIEEAHGSKILRFGKEYDGRYEWPQDEAEMGMSGMESVVKTGENIMFFLAASDPTPATLPVNPEAHSAGVNGQRSTSSVITYKQPRYRTDDHAVFGTVHSAMDAISPFDPLPSDVSRSGRDDNVVTAIDNDVKHVPHLFGAFSASPLMLTTSTAESLKYNSTSKPSRDHIHSRTKLGVVGLSLTVERRMLMDHLEYRVKRSQLSAEESNWYAPVEHEPSRSLDLGAQREVLEEAYESDRQARTTDEMEEFRGGSEWHKSQTEDVARVEDLFARMSDAHVDEGTMHVQQAAENHAKQGRPWDLPSDKPAGSDAKHALSALKRSRTGTGRQSHNQDRDGGK